jgi:hypothetical protein
MKFLFAPGMSFREKVVSRREEKRRKGRKLLWIVAVNVLQKVTTTQFCFAKKIKGSAQRFFT